MEPPSGERQITLASLSFRQNDPTVVTNPVTNRPALQEAFELTGGMMAISEGLYDAGAGVRIAMIYYDFATANIAGGGDWRALLRIASDDEFTTDVSDTSNLIAGAASGAGYHIASTAQRVRRLLIFASTRPQRSPMSVRLLHWRDLTIYGDHGLYPAGVLTPGGFYASDVITDIVSRAAPLLSTGWDRSDRFCDPASRRFTIPSQPRTQSLKPTSTTSTSGVCTTTASSSTGHPTRSPDLAGTT